MIALNGTATTPAIRLGGEAPFVSGCGGVLNPSNYSLAAFNGASLDATDFGAAVALVGDVDNNGAAELAIGAPLAQVIVLQFFDSKSVLLKSTTIKPPLNFGPKFQLPAGSTFGTSITGVGDVNGDGVPDISVVCGVGKVATLFLSLAGIVKDAVWSFDSSTDIPSNYVANTSLTYKLAVAGLGDTNGDGVVDLAVGDGRRGVVFVDILGANGTKKSIHVVQPNITTGFGIFVPDGSGFGASVAGIGDWNADGLGDLAVGAPLVRGLGAVYLVGIGFNASGIRTTWWLTLGGGNPGGVSVPGSNYGAAVAVQMYGTIAGITIARVYVGMPDYKNATQVTGAVYSVLLQGRVIMNPKIEWYENTTGYGRSLATAVESHYVGAFESEQTIDEDFGAIIAVSDTTACYVPPAPLAPKPPLSPTPQPNANPALPSAPSRSSAPGSTPAELVGSGPGTVVGMCGNNNIEGNEECEINKSIPSCYTAANSVYGSADGRLWGQVMCTSKCRYDFDGCFPTVPAAQCNRVAVKINLPQPFLSYNGSLRGDLEDDVQFCVQTHTRLWRNLNVTLHPWDDVLYPLGFNETSESLALVKLSTGSLSWMTEFLQNIGVRNGTCGLTIKDARCLDATGASGFVQTYGGGPPAGATAPRAPHAPNAQITNSDKKTSKVLGIILAVVGSILLIGCLCLICFCQLCKKAVKTGAKTGKKAGKLAGLGGLGAVGGLGALAFLGYKNRKPLGDLVPGLGSPSAVAPDARRYSFRGAEGSMAPSEYTGNEYDYYGYGSQADMPPNPAYDNGSAGETERGSEYTQEYSQEYSVGAETYPQTATYV